MAALTHERAIAAALVRHHQTCEAYTLIHAKPIPRGVASISLELELERARLACPNTGGKDRLIKLEVVAHPGYLELKAKWLSGRFERKTAKGSDTRSCDRLLDRRSELLREF